jgi:hypothetical protein
MARPPIFSKVGVAFDRDVRSHPLVHLGDGESKFVIKSRQRDGSLTGIEVSRLTKILHLLFVDDILILTRASVQEWTVIMELINKFCMASGLKVNPTKSTVHYLGLSETNLKLSSSVFHITFQILQWDLNIWVLSQSRNSKIKRLVWLINKVERESDIGAIDGCHWGAGSPYVKLCWRVNQFTGSHWHQFLCLFCINYENCYITFFGMGVQILIISIFVVGRP